jgi:leucyl-tRNA synthetase
MILGENGEKMSKSRGNVVNPDDIVNEYGADTMRLYEMFIGDFEKAAPWSQSSIKGCSRFLDKVFGLADILSDGDSYSSKLEAAFHKTVKKVSEDIEGLKMNTAIAAMMSLVNDISAKGSINRAEMKTLLLLLNPFAPHMTEELWEQLGFEGRLNAASWPAYDEEKCKDSSIEIVIQINGKVRSRISIAADSDSATVLALAKQDEKIAPALVDKTIVKELYVPGKLVNIVVK